MVSATTNNNCLLHSIGATKETLQRLFPADSALGCSLQQRLAPLGTKVQLDLRPCAALPRAQLLVPRAELLLTAATPRARSRGCPWAIDPAAPQSVLDAARREQGHPAWGSMGMAVPPAALRGAPPCTCSARGGQPCNNCILHVMQFMPVMLNSRHQAPGWACSMATCMQRGTGLSRRGAPPCNARGFQPMRQAVLAAARIEAPPSSRRRWAQTAGGFPAASTPLATPAASPPRQPHTRTYPPPRVASAPARLLLFLSSSKSRHAPASVGSLAPGAGAAVSGVPAGPAAGGHAGPVGGALRACSGPLHAAPQRPAPGARSAAAGQVRG